MALDFMNKKVGGVPVVYLGGVFVGVLVFAAWKMKPASGDPNVEGTDEEEDVSGDPLEGAYDRLATNGTVTVQQGTDPATVTPVSVQNNETWARNAANWLTAQGFAGGAAQTAMTKYVSGDNLSFEEGKMRDAAIKQFGVPPEPLVAGGTTSQPIGPAIPKKQGPLPRMAPNGHVVKNTAENDFYKLANLYYGSEHYDYVNFLEVANLSLPKGHNALPIGTPVNIPKYVAPKYYITTGTMSAQDVASKNGTSAAAVLEFNDALKWPVKKGTKVRVR